MNWRRFRPRAAVAVGIIVILVITVSFLSMLGGKTAEVFTEVDQGLATGGGAPRLAATAAPQGAQAPLEEMEYAADESGAVSNVAQQQNAIERMIIKSADLSLQVENVREAEAAVSAQVAALGGYVVRVEMSGTDERMTAHMTFRVPAERFDETLTGVQGLAKKVLSRTVSGDDVTEEFVDLRARLGNLEATRDRLRNLLEQAVEVEDALEVNRALTEVQGQIELLQGRMEYLQQSAALSTITVYLSPVPVTPIVTQGSWQPLAVARDALRSLVELGQGVVNLAIVLLVWTPVWLPLLLLGWWGWRRLRRQRGPGAGPTAPTAA
jgi:hypothetical protein